MRSGLHKATRAAAVDDALDPAFLGERRLLYAMFHRAAQDLLWQPPSRTRIVVSKRTKKRVRRKRPNFIDWKKLAIQWFSEQGSRPFSCRWTLTLLGFPEDEQGELVDSLLSGERDPRSLPDPSNGSY